VVVVVAADDGDGLVFRRVEGWRGQRTLHKTCVSLDNTQTEQTMLLRQHIMRNTLPLT